MPVNVHTKTVQKTLCLSSKTKNARLVGEKMKQLDV